MRFEVESRHVTRVWDLNSKLRAILAPIAAEFGWTPEEFLIRLFRGPVSAWFVAAWSIPQGAGVGRRCAGNV